MTRFQTSWAIAKRSWAVLKSDKTLAWFPVFSFLGSLVVVAVFGGLVALAGLDHKGNSDSLGAMGWVFIAFAYLALALVQTYFLAALVAGADARLRGGNSSVRTAMDVANSRLHRLLPWAVVSATVSLILNQLERQGIVGRIIASLIGLAWSLITFLTIPILVLEDVGVIAAFKRSGELFRKTWGENVVGQAGLGIVGFLLVLPAIPVVAAIGAALGTVGLVVFGGAALVWVIVSATVMAALSGIYRTALYHFAATGQVPGDFADIDFKGAFQARNENGGGFAGGFGGFSRN